MTRQRCWNGLGMGGVDVAGPWVIVVAVVPWSLFE